MKFKFGYLPVSKYKGDNLDRKEEIIKKALKLFLQKGYEKASLNDIAREVGISKPGVYYYFASKDALFREVLSYFMHEMKKWSIAHFQSCKSLRDFLQAIFTSLKSPKEVIENIIGETQEVTPYSFLEILLSASKKDYNIKTMISQGYSETREHIKAMLLDAQQKGEIRADIDCDTFAFKVIALSEGISFVCSFDDSIDIDIIGEKIFNNIWKMLSV